MGGSWNQFRNLELDRFLVLEILGQGGFGIVTKAYDKILNEFVAIKRFKKIENGSENQSFQEIILENELLTTVEKIRVNDPNCEKYFLKYDGVFKDPEDSSVLILKMESGCATLQDILKAGKVFSLSELIYVQLQIVEGFAKLEENGIANRDVKPANIILVEDANIEGKFYFKISDFGICPKILYKFH